MPNPFARRPVNTSQSAPTERKGMDPVPEAYAGFNLPYRGVQMHGVEPTADPVATPGYPDKDVVVYEDEVPEPEPVPVRVVNREARFRRTWKADSKLYAYNAGQAFQLLPREENRVKAVVTNFNTTYEALIGASEQMADWLGGYPIGTRASSPELNTTEEIYVLIPTPAAVDVRIGYIAEYEVPIPDDE